MPTEPKDLWVESNELRLRYRDWGGAGRPIVLLHGLASTCHIWDLVAPLLAEDFAVLALDQRGHGESDKPDSGYDFASVVQDLHGFIAGMKLEKPLVIGHSWGGDVALEYAVRYPDVPSGLGFVDGGMIEITGRSDWTLQKAKVEMAPPKWDGVTAESLLERARGWRPDSMLTSRHEEILMANFDVHDDRTISSRLSRENHLRIVEALWDHRPSELYPSVTCPVLLMPARQKDASPQERRFRREEGVARASKLLPVSETVWMEDSIHDVPLQRPELVAEVIRDRLKDGFFG